MLQVGVHEDDGIAVRVVESRHHRWLFAEIAREADVADVRVRLGERADGGECIVAAAVVDKEVGEGSVCNSCGRRLHRLVEAPHNLRLVIAGYDNCNSVHSSSLIYPWVRLANA